MMNMLQAFWPIYLLCGTVFVIATVVRSAWFKGWVGELGVNIAARLLLDKRRYHLIRNVTIPTEDGTTQIDHVIVSAYGVFVVETKNMRGWIFGGERDRTWTQKIFKQSFKFQNPLHQNYKHTQTLAEMLGLSPESMISVVAFIGDSVFKTAMPSNVTMGWGFIRFVRGHRRILLSEEKVRDIIERIAEKRLAPGIRTHLRHVEHVREIVAEKKARR